MWKQLFHKMSPGTRFAVVAGLALAAYACANVVAPTGGPRDEDPPKVVRSTPPNRSTNFGGGQIRIFFDEFVELRDIRQQLLISPPLQQLPEVNIRGRSIVLEVEEGLRPNTTYNLFFGDAIRDITEGNAIPNFQFVFSTGDYVDSLSVSGRVNNAFNLGPEEGVYVMLYDNIYDSVPYLERPVYLAKTDKNGQFTISNMADGEYLIFALDDRNNNFLYDMPGERIAFLDSLIRPQYNPSLLVEPGHDGEEEVDTDDTQETTTEETGETVIEETGQTAMAETGETTIQQTGEAALNGVLTEEGAAHTENALPGADHFYQLWMFEEEDTVQRVVSSALVREGLIRLAFRVPFDSAYVREIRSPFEGEWHIPEFNLRRDTLKLWFAGTGRDSLFLEVIDGDRVLDTIRRATRPRRVREREADPVEAVLQIRLDARRTSALPFFQPLAIVSENPVEHLDTNRIAFYINDSIPLPADFRFTDHVRRRVELAHELKEDTVYHIRILPGAFTDIFGQTNDTLATRLRTTSRENYGHLILRLELPPGDTQYILQLLDRNEAVLREKIIHTSDNYTFRYLGAGTYHVRLIEDLKGSGQWDTGHYLRQIQPEPVHMLPDTIRIRENWDVELPWFIETGSR